VRGVSVTFDPLAYQKARRDRARVAGLCIQCAVRAVVAGRSRCQACLDNQARWQVVALGHAEGGRHCTECNEPGHDRRTCRSAAKYVEREWCGECLVAGFHREGCQ